MKRKRLTPNQPFQGTACQRGAALRFAPLMRPLNGSVRCRMTRISIFNGARRELLNRMAYFAFATAVLITGPMLHDCRAPDSLEEAWLLERAYGPPQRWILDIVPRRTLEETPIEPGETLQIQDVSGIRVGLLTSKTVPHLAIDLKGDSLRVLELDA